MKLERKETSKKSSWALAAANIRKELKKNFPNVKFKVRSKAYTGGSSINVYWTDGPSYEKVNKIVLKIVSKYEKGYFDGSVDLYKHHKNFDDSFGSAKYIFLERSISEKTQRILEKKFKVKGETSYITTLRAYHYFRNNDF